MKIIKSSLIIIMISMVFALNGYAAEPYNNYIYSSDLTPQAEPQAYIPETIIDGGMLGTTDFNGPMDVFVAEDNRVYIADTGNNRILILNKDLKLEKEINSFDNNGKVDTFNKPQGVFVTNSNEMFVADTDNSRVISFTVDGKVNRFLGKPETQAIQGDYKYQPIKVAVDKANRIFVVSLNLSEGIVEYDKDGKFLSFFGSVKTIPDIAQVFWRFLAQSFPQFNSLIVKNIPTEYSSIAVDNKGFIFGTVGIVSQNSDKNFVKRLNPMGIDILRRYDRFVPPNGDIPGTAYNPATGEIQTNYSRLCDVAIRENGIYSVLDYNMGRIFTYSFNGELMYTFGAIGTKFGQSGQPVALDVIYKDHYLVVDNKYNQIIMYKPTEYGTIISEAVGNFFQREYDKSGQSWKSAINFTAKSRLVYDGYAKLLYQTNDYINAMKFYKYAKNDIGFSNAYEGNRTQIINKQFTLIFCTFVLLIVLIITLSLIVKRMKKRRR